MADHSIPAAGVDRFDYGESVVFIGRVEALISAGIITPEMVPPPGRIFNFYQGKLTRSRLPYRKRDEHWLFVSSAGPGHLLVERWKSKEGRLQAAVRVAAERLGAPDAAEVGRHVSRVFAAGQDEAFQRWMTQTVGYWVAPSNTPAPRGGPQP